MPWEELLKLHETGEDKLDPVKEDRFDTGSLIRQVAALTGHAGPGPAVGMPRLEAGEPVYCADGYLRRSPVQPYFTAADFRRRRVRKIITAVLLLCLAALLVVVLLRSGLFKLK